MAISKPNMKFIKWSEVENLPFEIQPTNESTTKAMNRQIYEQKLNADYILLEKVDGCNLSLSMDNRHQIGVNKRSGAVDHSENFMGGSAHRILERYQDELERLFKMIEKDRRRIIHMQVFGELCGGYYKLDKDEFEKFKDKCGYKLEIMRRIGNIMVFKESGAFSIIPRVPYTPRNEFVAFGLYLETDETQGFLSQREARDLLIKAGFIVVPEIGRGKLGDMRILSKKHVCDPSLLPQMFNLPPPASEDLDREGNILAPLDHDGFGNWWKDKGEKFLEQEKVKSKEKKEPTADMVLIRIAQSYVNNNRIMTAKSKIGQEITKTTKDMYIEEVFNDAMKDFEKEHDEYTKLGDKDKIKIKNKVKGFVTGLIYKAIRE